jgi:hypothetical protein
VTAGVIEHRVFDPARRPAGMRPVDHGYREKCSLRERKGHAREKHEIFAMGIYGAVSVIPINHDTTIELT